MEVVALALSGTLFIWLGRKCLRKYREEFLRDPRRTLTLDLGRAFTGSFSWAMTGAALLFVGIALCGIAGLFSALYLGAVLGLLE
jgi:hypothetical protein